MLEAVAASKKAKLPPILGGYLRERLAELCEALSLESSGSKPALVERLTGKSPAGKPDEASTQPPEKPAKQAKPAEHVRNGVLAEELGPRTQRAVPASGVEVEPAEPSADNPYPGLDPFTEKNRRYFFGREDDLSLVLSRLGGVGVPLRQWLFVDGASGVGKSSFLQAGLLAALRDGGAQSQGRPLPRRPTQELWGAEGVPRRAPCGTPVPMTQTTLAGLSWMIRWRSPSRTISPQCIRTRGSQVCPHGPGPPCVRPIARARRALWRRDPAAVARAAPRSPCHNAPRPPRSSA